MMKCGAAGGLGLVKRPFPTWFPVSIIGLLFSSYRNIPVRVTATTNPDMTPAANVLVAYLLVESRWVWEWRRWWDTVRHAAALPLLTNYTGSI